MNSYMTYRERQIFSRREVREQSWFEIVAFVVLVIAALILATQFAFGHKVEAQIPIPTDERSLCLLAISGQLPVYEEYPGQTEEECAKYIDHD